MILRERVRRRTSLIAIGCGAAGLAVGVLLDVALAPIAITAAVVAALAFAFSR